MLLARASAFACVLLLSVVSTSAIGVTHTVTSTADSGAGSLRDTLATASAGDTITFAVSGSIALLSPLTIAQSVTIQGPGPANLTLNGQSTVQIIAITAGTVALSGVTVANGTTTGLGGGINIAGGAGLTVNTTVFSANAAANGGAIANLATATLTVDNCTFTANTTTGVGGGALINSGTATLSDSTFVDNTAPINGGAINAQPGGTTTVINSTFVGNTSNSLGGAMSNLGTIAVYDSTFSANQGSAGGVIATGNTNVIFDNNVFADNVPDVFNPATGNSGSNNVFFNNDAAEDATGYGTTNFVIAPAEPLGTLGNNGGPTQTILPVAGGAAICAGSTALIPAGVTHDQRGHPRTSGACVDAGSVQLSVAAAAVIAAPTLSLWMSILLGGLLTLVGLRVASRLSR